MSHTYVVMHVSIATYEEIRAKLLDAGYTQALDGDVGTVFERLDMHGIALEVGRPCHELED